tara:strand:- start:1956 stop:3170 length:1215 start_codon:yes stop_codon:yes gene_type:complete
MAKRILIYTNHYYPEQFKINDVVDWLHSMGYKIRVVTCIPNYPSGRFHKGYNLFNSFIERKNNIIINRLPLIPRGNGNSFMLILNYLSYFISCSLLTLYLGLFIKKYDLILVHHTSPLLVAINPIIYGLFKKSRKILWDLDIWPETLEAVEIIKSKSIINSLKKVVSYIYSFYDTILISSLGLERIVRERYDGNIEYFPNWADRNIEDLKIDSNIKLNIPNNKFVIMYTGNMGKSQNFESLIKTIRYFDDTKKILWIFVGNGRFKNRFINKLSTEKLEHNCLFIDQVDIQKIPSYSNYADAMFLSLNENKIFNNTLPAKLQTYMALKKPIIGVLKGEGERIILESNSGIVENKNDYLSLAKKIEKLLELKKNEIERFGTNGREYYEKKFNSKQRKIQLQKIIEL